MINKPAKWHSEKYIKFLKSQKCCRCEKVPPCEVHHLRKFSDGGTGLKPSDAYGLPACRECHDIMQKYEQDEGNVGVLVWRYNQCLKYLIEWLAGEDNE